MCVFQPRTICFQYIRICFSLERKCVFDLIILILIILVSYLGDWSSRGTRRRCENRQVVANCAIIPRNLILAFIFLFLFLTIISDMEFALGTKKKKRERCDIPDGRQYPRKNIETEKSHIGDMMGKIKEKEEGGGGLRLPVSVALVSELSEGRGKTCQVSSASTARAQVCSSYTWRSSPIPTPCNFFIT